MGHPLRVANIYQQAQLFRQQLAAKDAAAASRMRAAYALIEKQLKWELENLLVALVTAQNTGQPVNEAWLKKQARYRSLLAQIKKQIAFYNQAVTLPTAEAQQQEFVQLAEAHARGLLERQLTGPNTYTTQFNRLPKAALEQLVGQAGNQSPLGKLLVTYAGDLADQVRDELLLGVAQGKDAAQIAKRVNQWLNQPPYVALRLVRTESFRAYREASRLSYLENGVTEFEWVASKSARTCAACLALDGKRFPATKPMPAHINCRCTLIPRWPEMTVPPQTSGAKWLAQQSPEDQKLVLGEAGAKAFRAGLPLKNWIGVSKSKEWGEARYQRSLAEALKGPVKGAIPAPLKPKPAPKPVPAPTPIVLPAPAPVVPLVPPTAAPPPPIAPAALLVPPPPPPKPKPKPKPKTPKPLDPLKDPNAVVIFDKTPRPGLKINGIALKTAAPQYWEKHKELETSEPDDPAVNGSGLVVIEPDGRMWIVEPKGHYGGYEHTFPKGKFEPGLTPQQNALKEVWEEAGLQAEIKGYLGDFQGTTGKSRYYIAKRTGGAPWDAHWESDKVKLIPIGQAAQFLNTKRDKDIAAALVQKLQAEPDLLKKKLKVKPKPKPPKAPPALKPSKPVKLAPALPPAAPLVSSVVFPPDPEKLKLVKKLGGSTGAELVEDEQGRRFVRKRGNNPGHLREEFYADQAYRALGIFVPEARLYESPGGPVKLAEFIEGKTLDKLSGLAREKAEAELRRHFAADALFGNWDVIGLSADNVLVGADGKVWRIDNGGSFRYRAQGAQKKPEQFNQYPLDLWSMRDEKVNPSAARVFRGLDFYEIARQAETLQAQRAQLRQALPVELRDVLGERLDQLADVAKVARTFEADRWKSSYVDGFARHLIGLRHAGVIDRLPKKLTNEREGQVTVKDEKGKTWDALRGTGSIVNSLASYLKSVGADQRDIADFVSAQSGSSWSGTALGVKGYLAEQRDAAETEYWWNSRNRASALGAFEGWKRSAKGNVEAALQTYHAFHFELFSKVDMPGNDRQAGVKRLLRTESKSVLKSQGVKLGDNQYCTRGVHESASAFGWVNAVAGPEVTVQYVPHHRITFSYLLGARPDSDQTGFLGDHENEVMFLPEGIRFSYKGTNYEDATIKRYSY